ncbi:MAG: hypothetical protein ACHQFZ_10795 [Acidimicrobiales bacterium]
MRYIWEPARVKLLVAAVVAVAVVVAGIALLSSSALSTNASTVRKSSASATSAPAYHPLRVMPPQTAIQRTADQTMQQSSSSQDVAALEAATFPAPATSASFPAIESTDSSTPSMYALAFTQELLGIDFATSTRNELLAWAGYNNAPDSLIEMPLSAQAKGLAASLIASPAVVPTPSQWASYAAARTIWRASGLVISVNPAWTQLLSTSWQSVDPLMVIYDVSGTLTITTPGRAPVVDSISFGLTLGGASFHPGYGAVAVDYWTVN